MQNVVASCCISTVVRLVDLSQDDTHFVWMNKSPKDEAEALVGEGLQRLVGLGQLVEALSFFDRAIKLQPNLTNAHILRGNVLRAMGRLDEALDSVSRAVELSPNDGDLYGCLGSLLTEVSQLRSDEAIAAFDRAIELGHDAHNLRADALRDAGRFVEPAADAARANEDEPIIAALRAGVFKFDESNKPGYTVEGRADRQTAADLPPGIMPDAKHDLNKLADSLGLTFEQAAAGLAEATRKADPLRRARRVVRNFENRQATNPDLPVPREVVDARSFVNRANYQSKKAKTLSH